MCQTINPQMQLGEVDISAITFNPKSRDDIPCLLRGLQHIWITPELRHKVFQVLESMIPASRHNGRPGMELWNILLFSVFMTLKLWDINPNSHERKIPFSSPLVMKKVFFRAKIWLSSYLQACAENDRKPPEDLTLYLPWLIEARHQYYRYPQLQRTIEQAIGSDLGRLYLAESLYKSLQNIEKTRQFIQALRVASRQSISYSHGVPFQFILSTANHEYLLFRVINQLSGFGMSESSVEPSEALAIALIDVLDSDDAQLACFIYLLQIKSGVFRVQEDLV